MNLSLDCFNDKSEMVTPLRGTKPNTINALINMHTGETISDSVMRSLELDYVDASSTHNEIKQSDLSKKWNIMLEDGEVNKVWA